jgi:pimeloyl-ACP methyl ester carboxylesterase
MAMTKRIAAIAAGAAGAAAVGGVLDVSRRRRRLADRRATRRTVFGTLNTPPRHLVTADGVDLHVEIDEADSALTLVFVHGYTLNLDCWHFQRAAFRGLVRSVYYDQRSHGRSGRSSHENATIDQLGDDLLQVLDAFVPDGPVVLVGHSMGGMTIVALAEKHPELFKPLSEGGRVVGVALISTTAGGLDPSRILLPMVPAKIGAGIAGGAMRTLARGHRAVDGVRKLGYNFASAATDTFAFGDEVPEAYVAFVTDMIAMTPFQVVAQFFPGFREMDKFDFVSVLSAVPTTIICGTADKLTAIGHSRKLHSRIAGSTLVECPDAGHMVILERQGQVNAALDQLLARAEQA